MATAEKPLPRSAHQLKVTLVDVDPPIWRRLQVRSSATLADLHGILQMAMGWQDYHLHQFTIAGTVYRQDEDGGRGGRVKDERRAKLARLAPEGASFLYEYDFGDSWEHQIVVEKVASGEVGGKYPRCTAGRRACPPEDCGGRWGYAQLLETIADPAHEEHDEMMEWLGGSFDPEAFDVAVVNRGLALVR